MIPKNIIMKIIKANLPIPKTKVSLKPISRVVLLLLFLVPLLVKGIGLHQGNIGHSNYYSSDQWQPVYLPEASMAGMTCYPQLNLSLGASGKAKILPSMILKPDPVNDADYKVRIYGTSTDTLTCLYKGQKVKVEVTEIATGNKCWTFILVEDKMAPSIQCRDTSFLCVGNLSYLDSIPGLYIAGDNCTPLYNLKITHIDRVEMLECSSDTFSIVRRTWTVIDPYGWTGSCTHNIALLRPQQSDIDFPNDTTLYCPDTDASPSNTGQPTIEGQPLDKFCGWSFRYDDVVFNKCGQTKKIWRTWSVLDCCSLEDTTVTQWILISDTSEPIIQCAPVDTVSTLLESCEAKYLIPEILSAFDSCHSSLTTIVKVDGLLIAVPGSMVLLEIGTHSLEYQVSDPCGNTYSCMTSVVVEDTHAPVFWCTDTIQIGLPADRVLIGASFSEIEAVDNCSLVGVQIRRRTDFCVDGSDDTAFGDSIAICCSDVNNPFDIVFVATDIYGNQDSCVVTAVVVDKSPPVLTCEQDTTILCGEIIPDWKNPLDGLTDNCMDSITITIDTLIHDINTCGIGQTVRQIIATDLAGNQDTCIQRIAVSVGDTLTPDDINLATDTVRVTGCNLSLLLPDSIGFVPPTVDTPMNACHQIFIAYTDSVQPLDGTGLCRITHRTWSVGDSCYSTFPVEVLIQVILQDTTAPSPLHGGISGKVISIASVPIEKVHIEGKNMQAQPVFEQMTGEDGQFSTNRPEYALKIRLEKEDPAELNGISTLDLIKIQKHILGERKLEHPLLEYAADIDRNGLVNVLDLIALRKKILGLSSQALPWHFVDKAAPIAMIHPGSWLPEEYLVFNKNASEEFIGFKMGDVNMDAVVNHTYQLEGRSASITELILEDTGEGLLIKTTKDMPMLGLQLSLVSEKGWEGTNLVPGFNFRLDGNWAVNGSEMKISLIEKQAIVLEAGTVLFKIRGAHSKNVFSGTLHSEWYDNQEKALPIRLVKSGKKAETISISAYPNPVSHRLNIRLQGQPLIQQWRLVNQHGRITSQDKSPGETTPDGWTVDMQALPSGVYWLEIILADGLIIRHKVLKIN